MRITKDEYLGAIELFVNSIYDNGDGCGWANATFEEWVNAVYKELTTWKSGDYGCYNSNENRFDGKENIIKNIKKYLKERLIELKSEGYNLKAI